MGEASAPRSGGVLQHIFGAGGARCTKQGGGPAHDFICLGELARVLWGHVGQAHDVVTIANWGRSSGFGVSTEEESGHGERGAGRRREDRRVVPAGTSLEDSLVDRVNEHVMFAAASVGHAIVHTIRIETEAREE
eukprot:2566499-Pleurochrysis_carterae.AAC.1